MLNLFHCLDEKFSTTKIVTKNKPIIENNPKDKFGTVLFLPEIEGRKDEGGLRTQGYFKQSLPEKPLITVITVVYNSEQYLEETIISVLNQTYDNIEYIIIDGGSTDKTLEIIKKYDDVIDYWISEPDQGIYDAMNKGISQCHGEIVGFLNAGDLYNDHTIEQVINIFMNNKFAIITGNCKVILNSQSHWIIESGDYCRIPYRMIPHPSVFVPLSIYQEYGTFDKSLKIAGDYDVLLRCYSKSVKFIYINDTLAIAAPRGVSGNYYLTELEFTKVRLRYKLLPLAYNILLSAKSLISITIHIILEFLGLWKLIERKRHGSIC